MGGGSAVQLSCEKAERERQGTAPREAHGQGRRRLRQARLLARGGDTPARQPTAPHTWIPSEASLNHSSLDGAIFVAAHCGAGWAGQSLAPEQAGA